MSDRYDDEVDKYINARKIARSLSSRHYYSIQTDYYQMNGTGKIPFLELSLLLRIKSFHLPSQYELIEWIKKDRIYFRSEIPGKIKKMMKTFETL